MMLPLPSRAALLPLMLVVLALVFFVLWRSAERRAQVGFNSGWIAYFLADLRHPQCHIGPPLLASDGDRPGPFVPRRDEVRQ
jgi:hypothetical protein